MNKKSAWVAPELTLLLLDPADAVLYGSNEDGSGVGPWGGEEVELPMVPLAKQEWDGGPIEMPYIPL